jgi:putative dimethyl sulfoxide reductase chaperone
MQLIEYFKARQNFYSFLQYLFYEPISEQTIVQLKESGNLEELQNLNEAGKYLYQFFSNATVSQLQEQKDEFYRLFVGPETIIAPPWESVYRSKEGLLFEETTYQVRENYHEFGLRFVQENNEPDDHIAIELEFILHLNGLCLVASNDGQLDKLLDHQIQFLEQHMNQWIPAFCEKILNQTDSLLYKGAALLLRDFTRSDYESLMEIKEAFVYVR